MFKLEENFFFVSVIWDRRPCSVQILRPSHLTTTLARSAAPAFHTRVCSRGTTEPPRCSPDCSDSGRVKATKFKLKAF